MTCAPTAPTSQYSVKTPQNLSPRIQWLRDYFFQGVSRAWNNEYTSWTTGVHWDFQYNELTFYIVPETYFYLPTFRSSFKQSARPVALHPDFWQWSIVERRAWFVKEVMTRYLPQEILPGDLLAGGRFNIVTSCCLDERQAKEYDRLLTGKDGARQAMLWFHNHGFGNTGATSGHLIPDYPAALQKGWQGIYAEIEAHYQSLPPAEQAGPKGAQLRAMLTSATMAREVAAAYRQRCLKIAEKESDEQRKRELFELADILQRIPWEPARTFWEAVQALWLTHMLVMADENYPGPGVSFGRIDQYLLPYWERSLAEGMDREFGKEILKCFWMHANTAYDALLRTGGNQGITALRPIAHDLRVRSRWQRPDQRSNVCHPGCDRRNVAHFRAQAQCAPASRNARPAL
jgi:formate C-acetyltransferase